MDGYAVKWADVASLIDGGGPVTLKVTQEVPAGGWSEVELGPGEACRIFTGAPIPPGADHVIMQERTERLDDDHVRIDSTGRGPLDNVRAAGEDMKAGQPVAPIGAPLTAGHVGMLASQGVAEVTVRRRPVVAIVSTGDEIHEPGEDLPPGHIYSSNSYALIAMVKEAGGVPKYLGIAKDTPEALREIFAATEGCDAVVSIGGVSVGDYDYVRDVLGEMGEQSFWKVAMRPGKPNASGTILGMPYFGLPGNPVSCMVSFLQYVRPALRRLQGCDDLYLPTVDAVIEHDLGSKARFLFLFRGVLRYDRDHLRWSVSTTGSQGSGLISSMGKANCLIAMPEDVTQVAAGDVVRVQLLPGVSADQPEASLR